MKTEDSFRPDERQGIYINDDFANFYWNAPFEDMNEAGLRRQIDFYTKNGGVQAIIYNLNANLAYFDSNVFQPVWTLVEYDDAAHRVYYRGEPVSDWNARMLWNIREMYRNVADPTAVRKAYCHEKGVEFFLSFRTNDMHTVFSGRRYAPECLTLGDFWRGHEEYHRASYRRERSAAWANEALDFGEEEVRTRALAMCAEYLAYDPDGFEIDFMRHLPMFRPGFDEFSIPLMNDFMRSVRRLADESEARSGHRVRIAVRVPSAPDDALACGLDAAYWAKNGLCDIVEPSPSFCSNESDIPLELWRRMLPDEVVLSPYIELHNTSAQPMTEMFKTEPAIDRGFAATFYGKGADTVSLYNHFPYGPDAFPRDADMQELYAALGSREACENSHRRHIVTYRDNTYIEGRFYSSFMPYAVSPRQSWGTRICVGGGTAHRRARLIIAFSDTEQLPEVRLNTFVLQASSTPSVPFPTMPGCRDIPFLPVEFELNDGVLHDGMNLAEIYNPTEKDVLPLWMEIEIF